MGITSGDKPEESGGVERAGNLTGLRSGEISQKVRKTDVHLNCAKYSYKIQNKTYHNVFGY